MRTEIHFRAWRIAALLVLLPALPGFAWSVDGMGNLHGRAFDAQGAPWSGIEVTSTAPGQPARVQVTDAKGFYRFLGLPPGDYKLQVKMPDGSLQTVERVVISAGRNTVMKDFLVFEDAQEFLRCLESDCCGGDTEGCSAGACIPVLVAQPAGRR